MTQLAYWSPGYYDPSRGTGDCLWMWAGRIRATLSQIDCRYPFQSEPRTVPITMSKHANE